MSGLAWINQNYKINLQHNDRVNEIFDQYRIKLTGSLECRNEQDIYGFIYREQPGYSSEILYIMYRQGYEDGLKAARIKEKLRKAKFKCK